MAGLLDLMPQQQPQNWFDRGMQNPLTHLGLGLLQADAPRRSTNIADLNTGGLAGGILSGAQSYNQYQGQQQARAYKDQVMAQQRARTEMAQRQAQMEEDQARQAAMQREQMLANVDPAKRAQFESLFGLGLKEQAAQVAGFAPPDAQAESSALVLGRNLLGPGRTSAEYTQAGLAALNQRAASGASQINVGGGELLSRPLDAATAEQFGLTPEQAKGLMQEKGVIRPIPRQAETPQAAESRKKISRINSVFASLNALKTSIIDSGTEIVPGPVKSKMESQRADLVLELKDLYGLGALTGPDVQMMEDVIGNPTTFWSKLTKDKDNFLAQISVIEDKLASARAAVGGTPATTTPLPSAPSDNGWDPRTASDEDLKKRLGL